MLENGFIVENETPDKLLADEKSLFFSMARDAGISAQLNSC